MSFDHYVRSGQKLLRCGYTTGTCAALAARGAAELLLSGAVPRTLQLVTPKGWPVQVLPAACRMEGDAALCGVEKDAGDDCDITDGMTVQAVVSRTDGAGILIDGGEGVGRVTRPGLDQPVGAAAINSVPRRMIGEEVRDVCRRFGYTGGLRVEIRIPGGAEAAQKTFNPKLGIEGGLSVLGTSGVVEPMSEQALVDTIGLEIRQAAAQSKRLILTPGNYGADFLHANGLDSLGVPVVKCSNFIGDALDMAAAEGIETLLLVGHMGKLVKLAGGVMNTHSRWADCRTELICAHAAVCGAGQDFCTALLAAPTTDACLELLDKAGLREAVLQRLVAAMAGHVQRRAGENCRAGIMMFSNQYGLLGLSDTAKEILAQWNE